MNDDYIIDLITWHTNRFLDYKPDHFVIAKTPVTNESHLWIYCKLKGRFSLTSINTSDYIDPFDVFAENYPAFEDPQEAIFYELTWS